MGGPLSNWSWLKASLPSSHGGLNLRSASLHAPAAFLASSTASKHLVECILGHPPSSTLHTIPVVRALATTAAGKILMISMSLYGNALFPTALMRPPSRTYSLLPPPFAHELWHTLQVCLMQGTGLMWHHWVFTFKTENSNAACGTGWEFLSKVIHFLAQNAGTLLTSLVITRLGVVEMVTAFPGIMIRDMVFSAALAPSKETPGLLASSLSRPADILLPNWKGGHPAALDVHVISPLQQQTLNEASFTPGHALQVRKLASSLSACRLALHSSGSRNVRWPC